MNRWVHLASIFLAVSSLAACSGKPPSFANVKWYIVDRPAPQSEKAGQVMSLFAAVQDPDGVDDIEEFYLICDSSRFFWKLDKDQWEKKEQDGNTWIGSNGFSYPSGGDFPDGTYRVLIIDSGGERVEREINVGMAGRPKPSVPVLKLQGDRLEVQCPFPGNQLMMLDANDESLFSLPVQNGVHSLEALVSSYPERSLGRSVMVLSVSEGANRAAMSGKIQLP